MPQDAAFGVAPGIDAIVRVPELPDREFPGKVTRIADALQPGTRTLLTEIDIPNPDGALTPGIYCTVELHIPRKTPSLSVPADAIIFNRNGMQVAVVSNGKAEIRKVRVKRDFGTRVEVDTGIKAGDQVILNPPVTLIDGSKVRSAGSAAHIGWLKSLVVFLLAKEADMLLHLPIAILATVSPVAVSDTVPKFDIVRECRFEGGSTLTSTAARRTKPRRLNSSRQIGRSLLVSTRAAVSERRRSAVSRAMSSF